MDNISNGSELEMEKKEVFVVKKSYVPAVKKLEMEIGLEEALDIVGAGKYQIFHCTLMLATLSSSLLEMIGSAFILPAATCDLDIPENLRGILTSVPNIGIILTAPFWGRAADTLGRKPVLLLSCALSGMIGFTASFMPNLISFALCKLAGSFFLSCPTSLGFAYVGELMPRRRRDIAVLTCNGLLMLTSSLSPILAWCILPYDWHYHLGVLTLRPWRLLTAVYAVPLLLTALWMTRAKESPKFLMMKGKHREALDVLRHIYSVNTGSSSQQYCVTALKYSAEESGNVEDKSGSDCELTQVERSESMMALLRPPHLRWMALIGFLMFGLFSSLNGLFLFAPDTLNKVIQGSSDEEGTICILMNQAENQTSTETCVDTISNDTFLIMVVTTVVYALVVMAISLTPLTKKTQLVGMYTTVGCASLTSGLLRHRMVAGIAMSALQVTALGIGPLTAYAVQLFPTSLRGTAVGAVIMFGRLGSVVGANAAGYLLTVACTVTFYGFSALLFLCAALSFLLPKDQTVSNSDPSSTDSG